jgi:hypothetical protein
VSNLKPSTHNWLKEGAAFRDSIGISLAQTVKMKLSGKLTWLSTVILMCTGSLWVSEQKEEAVLLIDILYVSVGREVTWAFLGIDVWF